MTNTGFLSGKSRIEVDLPPTLGLSAIIFFFVCAGLISYWNIHILERNSRLITQTHEIILGLDDLLSIMKDAETGQRGFVITGDEKYLEPYNSALTRIENRLDELDMATRDNPDLNRRFPEMKAHIHAKLAELKDTINLRRREGFGAARDVVVSDLGKNEMDVLRLQIGQVREAENSIRDQRIAEMENAYRIAVLTGVLTCTLGIILSLVVAFMMNRAAAARRRQQWLQLGQVQLSEAILGEQQAEQLGANVLKKLAEYLNAPVGAFFVRDGSGFRRVAVYGVPPESTTVEKFAPGDGLLGQVAKDRQIFIVSDIPDNYLTFGSALGQSKPRHLAICPASGDGVVNTVFELGFLQPPSEAITELLERVSEMISVAVRSANYRLHLQNLLEETQRQGEELQAQSEELRVNNEELEEQSRALKESQSRLEQQQAELEQTNSQLEEQTQLLEAQRDDLARSKEAVQDKARELERASQYKSDFLANMSHELRTPLNSSLILAKLLADNPEKNLTDEQVKFAQTIQSSGNDLLTLINDILDLSKIEAGHMDVHPERLSLARMSGQLARVFAPVAHQKGLVFQTSIARDCPSSLETDPVRLEQILKNLLSNSIKFTEKGSVHLTISRPADKQIAFAVTDTGIGIAPENQQAIFDAFRQADGTINRKYGGTGLGLSISRELTRLLGGTIHLESVQGKGSTFRVVVPETYEAPVAPPRVFHRDKTHADQVVENELPTVAPTPQRAKKVNRSTKVADDTNQLLPNDRVILAVEDDESFAAILYKLAHEYNFKCLIASTAEQALEITAEFAPSAILLDVGLPDHSGLSVLDRLKRDSRTRHIPVHVISASDYTQTAFSLGAVGYMMKPVKRDQLEEVLKQLEKRLVKGIKRVLIVEDNAVQRKSMIKLLSAHNVETVDVGTAAECLEQLKTTTFDCMVLDLSLPDATGYSLLETLSKEDAYSFPPVIVYTGRDLSSEEEQRLRRYSSAIIIKGAKSHERLLDEVTLFLHQVVADLPSEQQRMLAAIRGRDDMLEGRRILAVEDDVRNIYALTSIFEPLGVSVQIARNGREALDLLTKCMGSLDTAVDLVLMDVMMPEMDGLTATREIRKNPAWKKLPVIMLTAKAMKDDQEKCLEAGANDYMAKPLDVEKLLSLVRVWMPR